MSAIPMLPPLPLVPATQRLPLLPATAQAQNSIATPTSLQTSSPSSASPSSAFSAASASSLPTLPLVVNHTANPTSAAASSSPSDASSSTATNATASSASSSSPSASTTAPPTGEREYYDAPGSTVRGSTVWQSIRLIRGDDDHVHCMRCGKDLKHNRTQARLTGTSNLSRHLRKCKGPPLAGAAEGSEEHKENGGGGDGSAKKRKREVVSEEKEKDEEKKDEKKEATTNGPRSQRGAAQLENGERAAHHASLQQLQALHDAALTRVEQSKQVKTEQQQQQQAEQLSSDELRKLMQWHSTAIQRLQRLAAQQLSEEWKDRAGKNVCRCCTDVESEVQLEPCKHVIWCRGCNADKCTICGTVVLAKSNVAMESRGDG